MRHVESPALPEAGRSAGLVWNGTTIQVRTTLGRRYLWLATSTDVLIDGDPVLRLGGFRFGDGGEADFEGRDGLTHRLRFHEGGVFVDHLPTWIWIDDELVYRGGSPLSRTLLWVTVAVLVLGGVLAALSFVS